MRSLLFSLIVWAFAACKSNKGTDSITGVWTPVEIGMQMTEADKKLLMEKASIEFTNDGKYISYFREEKEKGTYTYDPAAKTLTTNGPESGEDNFTVLWERICSN